MATQSSMVVKLNFNNLRPLEIQIEFFQMVQFLIESLIV